MYACVIRVLFTVALSREIHHGCDQKHPKFHSIPVGVVNIPLMPLTTTFMIHVAFRCPSFVLREGWVLIFDWRNSLCCGSFACNGHHRYQSPWPLFTAGVRVEWPDPRFGPGRSMKGSDNQTHSLWVVRYMTPSRYVCPTACYMMCMGGCLNVRAN